MNVQSCFVGWAMANEFQLMMPKMSHEMDLNRSSEELGTNQE